MDWLSGGWLRELLLFFCICFITVRIVHEIYTSQEALCFTHSMKCLGYTLAIAFPCYFLIEQIHSQCQKLSSFTRVLTCISLPWGA